MAKRLQRPGKLIYMDEIGGPDSPVFNRLGKDAGDDRFPWIEDNVQQDVFRVLLTHRADERCKRHEVREVLAEVRNSLERYWANDEDFRSQIEGCQTLKVWLPSSGSKILAGPLNLTHLKRERKKGRSGHGELGTA